MKKVSGVRCRVSVIGRRVAWITLTFGLIGYGAAGQNLRYSFKKGEIIDFELIQKPTKGNGYASEPETTRKYQFSVNGVSSGTYSLTLKFRGIYSAYMWLSDKQTDRDLNRTGSDMVPNIFNILYNIEMNHPVSFTMDSQGKILHLSGTDSLLAAIIDESNRTPDMKRFLEFNRIKVRYGDGYYIWLIHEFFPEVTGTLSDTLLMESGNNKVTRINVWDSDIKIPDSLQPIRLRRSYHFQNDSKYQYDFPKKDIVSDMYLTWPAASGHPTRISYKGYVTDYLSFEVSLQGSSAIFNYADIEIFNTGVNNSNTEKVVINGRLTNIGDNRVLAYLPGNHISKTKSPVKPGDNGSFRIEFDLDVPNGLVEIFWYTSPVEQLWASPGNPNQVRIFVKQGDSVDFSMSITEPQKINFRCRSENDQITLNRLSKKFVPGNPRLSMQTISENDKLIKRESHLLSPDFLRFMEIENRYFQLSYQAEEVSLTGFTKVIDPIDSLPGFVRHLGFSDGYKSDAYKEFLCDLVQSYCSAKILRIFGFAEGNRDLEISDAVLSGWDLYWYKAMKAEQRLEKFPYDGYDQLYQKFTGIYPGSEFQNQLYRKFKTTEKARVGTVIPDLTFYDLAGKKHSTHEFTGHSWILVNTLHPLIDLKTTENTFQRFIDHYLRGAKVVISFPQIRPEDINRLAGQFKDNQTYIIRNPLRKDDFGKHMTGLPAMILGISGDNRIAAYGQDSWMELGVYSSWPVSITRQSRAISLTTFWYSLAGAFILSLIIILSLRIRAKRREARLSLRRRMAQLEVDAVRSRMNPHFLFNALSSIQNLINRKQIEEANLYLARFGDLVRTILNQSSKPAIGLNEEIDMIRNYLQLEQLRFPFSFDIQVCAGVDTFAIEIPPLLIQPHVENAVMHGVSGLGKAGRILVVFRNEERHLVCEVKDNGPGYHPETKTGNGGLGQGWKLTRQRIDLMKELYGEDVSVEVTSGIPAGDTLSEYTGTTVIFRLPIQQTT